jgi:hypothetical protein
LGGSGSIDYTEELVIDNIKARMIIIYNQEGGKGRTYQVEHSGEILFSQNCNQLAYLGYCFPKSGFGVPLSQMYS